MPRKSAAAAPPPPPPADNVANEPDLADFLKQLVNVDDVGVGDAGGDRFLHPRGAPNPDAVWSDLDNLDVAWSAVYSNEPCSGVRDAHCPGIIGGARGEAAARPRDRRPLPPLVRVTAARDRHT